MRRIPKALTTSCLALVLALSLSACPMKTPPVPAAVTENAIVIRNFDTDLSARFSFANTVGKILESAGILNTPANREALVKTMTLSFNSSQFTNPLSGLAMPIAPRGGDAAILAADMLDPANPNGLKPIGLFNRLDLAPADWSDCGEHRIVYAGGNRLFLIFEAKLPNPNPSAGKQGCRAVAQRWADVSTAPSATQRNKLLEEFYYTGMPGFRRVVDFLNYGSFLGQVRTNILGQGPWQLREFRVLAVAAGQIAFSPSPVASNPLSSFYKNNPIGSPLEQSERTAFQAKFGTFQANMRKIDETEPAAASLDEFKRKLINGLGAGFDFQFNEFQSASQTGNEIPKIAAGPVIKAGIPPNWSSPIGTRTILQDQMINRAGAITCGGCHGLSSGDVIGSFNGTPISWPSVEQNGFVHISEQVDGSGNHRISDALAQFFIPFRQDVTNDILNTTTAMLTPRDRSGTALASLLVPQARAQPAPPRGQQESAPGREEAENAALQLVQGRVGAAEARQAAVAARRASDLAHAQEQVTPGAYVEFRRPH